MSGVRDYNSFGLHRKVIGKEFCSICLLLGSKLKPVATLLINKQNDSPKFFSLNNLLVEVCPLLQIEDLEFRLYWKSSTLKIVWISQNTPSKSCAIILDEDCCHKVLYVMQPYIYMCVQSYKCKWYCLQLDEKGFLSLRPWIWRIQMKGAEFF